MIEKKVSKVEKLNRSKTLKFFSVSLNIHTHKNLVSNSIFTYISTHRTKTNTKTQGILSSLEYLLYLSPVSIPSPRITIIWISITFEYFAYSCISYKWDQTVCVFVCLASSTYYFVRFIHSIVFFFLFYCCVVFNFMNITTIYLSTLGLKDINVAFSFGYHK